MNETNKRNSLEVGVSVGAMAPLLSEQLSDQGFEVNKVDVYEKNLDAVTRLLICGYMPQSIAKKCRDKILKDVFKNIRPFAKESK